MKKKPRKKQEAKPDAPMTFLEAVRKNKWGQGDRAMHPEPGKVEDKDWEPGPDDWALFAEMMRDRVNSMRDPKP